MVYTNSSGYPQREFRFWKAVLYDEFHRRGSVYLIPRIFRIAGVQRYIGHGYVSTSCRTFYYCQNHGRICCIVWSPVWHGRRSIGLPSVHGSRGKRTVSSVCMAKKSAPYIKRKAPGADCSKGSMAVYIF